MDSRNLLASHTKCKWNILVTNILQWCVTCSVLCTADCEKDVHKQRSTTAKIKPKLVKSPNKRPKTQNKAAPAARTQARLTQVDIYHSTLYCSWRVLAVCFVFLCHEKVLKKGKFKKVGETLSVLTGDTLELRCRGKRVQWSVPTYLQEDHDGRLK